MVAGTHTPRVGWFGWIPRGCLLGCGASLLLFILAVLAIGWGYPAWESWRLNREEQSISKGLNKLLVEYADRVAVDTLLQRHGFRSVYQVCCFPDARSV